MGSIADDFVRERAAFRQTLVELGPDAPTACGDWTTTDLAAHVAAGEVNGGIATAPFRWMVNRGIRIDGMSRVNVGATKAFRRRGFDWALRRLAKPPPRAHRLRGVVTVSLLEVWAHHEDVLMANGLRCESGIDLTPVVETLTRYQRKFVGDEPLPDSLEDRARVLSGRAMGGDRRLSI